MEMEITLPRTQHFDRIAYVDGACGPPNPGGPGGWGVFLQVEGAEPVLRSGHLPKTPNMTNNVAEYHAALVAVALCHQDGFKGHLLIRADSKLVVEQMKGNWSVKQGAYVDTYQRLRNLVDQVGFQITWEWVPREQNTTADMLSKKGLNNPTI